jgi:hypothetical protein
MDIGGYHPVTPGNLGVGDASLNQGKYFHNIRFG